MAQAPVVGLDIGSQYMKAVEISALGKRGLSVTGLTMAPTPPGALQNGMLIDPLLLAQAVKQMFKDGGIRSRKVIGCIAGQASVVVRIIEVPRMTPTELAETMKWEVERHVPFAPTEVQMDYQTLPVHGDEDANNPNMSVLLAVAQQDMVNYYVEALLKAGADPIAIDIEPLAAGRALLDVTGGAAVKRSVTPVALPGGDFATATDISDTSVPRETIAIVNVGATNTDISIFEDGMLIFPRSLALAGESLTRAISDGLGYQLEQAERLKIEHARVLLDRMNEYGDQPFQPEAVEFPYGQPEEDFSSMRPVGLPDSGPLGRSPFDSGPIVPRNPFDSGAIQPSTSDRIISGPLGSAPVFGAEDGGFNSPGQVDLDRTQPIQRRTLDLARRGPAPGTPIDLGPTGGFESAQPEAPDASSMTVQIFDAILPVLSELATELRRSLDYYRSRAAGKNVDRVVLCGGTASLPGIDQFLEQELQVPVQIAAPFAELNVTAKNADASYLAAVAPLFTVAVGLAERQAVFAANPAPVVKKTKAPKPVKGAATTNGTAGAGVTKAKGRASLTMPKLNFSFGKKDKGGPSIPPAS